MGIFVYFFLSAGKCFRLIFNGLFGRGFSLYTPPKSEDRATLWTPNDLLNRVKGGNREEGTRERVLFWKVSIFFLYMQICNRESDQ